MSKGVGDREKGKKGGGAFLPPPLPPLFAPATQATPPPSPPFKVEQGGYLLSSIGSSNSGTTLHRGDGGRKKLYFPLLKSVKRQKAPLGRSVSTYFVADCGGYID